MSKVHVLVIGGGGTGAAIIHDLAMRGFKTTLLERGELTSGTTGRHHGQLHSGARYAQKDPKIAKECLEENTILRKIAPEGIEFNYGLFVAISEEDVAYCTPFITACNKADIPIRLLTRDQALKLEPNINPQIHLAVQIPDGTMDAWRIPLYFFATAKKNGADIRTFSEVVGIHISAGHVIGVRVKDYKMNRLYTIKADVTINASGVWAGRVGRLAGIHIPVQPSPGTMIAVKGRLTNMVISRLRPPGDGDTIVPRRDLSIIGTTARLSDDPDKPEIYKDDKRVLLAEADKMVPGFSRPPVYAQWSAARPLIGNSTVSESRKFSRGFLCVDHKEKHNLEGFLSIIGGKATILRAMAENVVDMVCNKTGYKAECRTKDKKLSHYRDFYN